MFIYMKKIQIYSLKTVILDFKFIKYFWTFIWCIFRQEEHSTFVFQLWLNLFLFLKSSAVLWIPSIKLLRRAAAFHCIGRTPKLIISAPILNFKLSVKTKFAAIRIKICKKKISGLNSDQSLLSKSLSLYPFNYNINFLHQLQVIKMFNLRKSK